MTLAHLKGVVDLCATLLGVLWVVLALEVLALPWWLFVLITALIAFGAGWLRYDLRRHRAPAPSRRGQGG